MDLLEAYFAEQDAMFVARARQLGKHKGKVEVPPNDFFGDFDALCLYSMVSLFRPRMYVEVGSGWSTYVACKALDDSELNTPVFAIDPEPRVALEAKRITHFDRILVPQDARLTSRLREGDILFIDGSHQLYEGSDVSIFWIDIWPTLASGVVVHFHDIWLPRPYPLEWHDRFYTEQLMLAAMLLTAGEKFDILLPNGYLSIAHPEFGIGKSFWFVKKE